jgi:hypothetical protein
MTAVFVVFSLAFLFALVLRQVLVGAVSWAMKSVSRSRRDRKIKRAIAEAEAATVATSE